MTSRHPAIAFIALCILSASGATAVACGGAFMQALLFHQYPQARAVSKAIMRARTGGELPGEWWSMETGKTLHEWRVGKIATTIKVLERRLNDRAGVGVSQGQTRVFLINAFESLDIANDGDRVVVSKSAAGPRAEGRTIFTTRLVLDNLLDGTLTWRQGIDAGLIASHCNDGCAVDDLGHLTIARQGSNL